jgi:S1-C subfamily serine protease
MVRRSWLVPSLVVALGTAGFAVAGDSERLAPESVPEVVRHAASKLFGGGNVDYRKDVVYEVTGKDASGAPAVFLVDAAGNAFQRVTAGRPFLGIQLAQDEDGAVVGGVIADTAAAKAGLVEGDKIVKVGETTVASPEDLLAAIGKHAPGDTLALTIEREGWKKTITVTLGTRPKDEAEDKHDEKGEKDDDD